MAIVKEPLTVYWEFWADLGIADIWKLTMVASCSQFILYLGVLQSSRVIEEAFNSLIANWAVVP